MSKIKALEAQVAELKAEVARLERENNQLALSAEATRLPDFGLRAAITGHDWLTEITPVTGPMYQMLMFFMLTFNFVTTNSLNLQLPSSSSSSGGFRARTCC